MGIVQVKNNLAPQIDPVKANNTLMLAGLDRYGSSASNGDRRWRKRIETWGKAERHLKYFEAKGNPADYIPAIVDNATSIGFWSVWIEVFKNHHNVREAINDAFPGTFADYLFTDINRL
jgi:hypothetical protein